jgi:hypothetical protein
MKIIFMPILLSAFAAHATSYEMFTSPFPDTESAMKCMTEKIIVEIAKEKGVKITTDILASDAAKVGDMLYRHEFYWNINRLTWIRILNKLGLRSDLFEFTITGYAGKIITFRVEDDFDKDTKDSKDELF